MTTLTLQIDDDRKTVNSIKIILSKISGVKIVDSNGDENIILELEKALQEIKNGKGLKEADNFDNLFLELNK